MPRERCSRRCDCADHLILDVFKRRRRARRRGRRPRTAPLEGGDRARKLVAEFFFVNTESGACLWLLIGDHRSITPVVDLADHDGSSEEPSVSLLQPGGPGDSGVVDALLGRIVRCPPHAVDDVSFNGDAVPTSPQLWTRALLSAGSGDAVAVAVGTDPARIRNSLDKFSPRRPTVTDYVVYHFWRDRE